MSSWHNWYVPFLSKEFHFAGCLQQHINKWGVIFYLSWQVCEAEKKFEDSLKEKLVDQASAHSFHLQASLKKQVKS